MIGEYYNIDCMQLMAKYPDKHFDLAIVDPPYGIKADGRSKQSRDFYANGTFRIKLDPRSKKQIKYKTKSYKIGDWDNKIPDQNYFDELFRVSKNQIIFGENYLIFNQKNLSSGRIYWNKFVPNGMSYSDGELAWVSMQNKITQINFKWAGMMQGKSLKEGHILQGSNKLKESRIHPTHKPIKLYEWLLIKYAKPTDLILDTHVGSASSLIACENTGNKYVGCELDKDYYEQSKLCSYWRDSSLRLSESWWSQKCFL